MENFKEALKEGLRVVVLAIIPVVILGLENGNFNLKALGIVAVVAFLRFIDSYLHESGKAEKGLTRF